MKDLNLIKPKEKGVSDKYSWNLYNFLNRLYKTRDVGKYYKTQLEIHWLHESRWDGEWLDAPNNKDGIGKMNLNQLLIIPLGKENDRSFYHVSAILEKGKAERFALPTAWNTTDITDWFFKTYVGIGRCVFDRNHINFMQGTKDRFTYINNTRRCNWCGEWHKKEIEKEVKIKRRELWVAE